MALPDAFGYKAFWHYYKGKGQPYRLLYPYNYNPSVSYPLIVMSHGSGELGSDNTKHLMSGSSIAGLSTNGTEVWRAMSLNNSEASAQYYQAWPCFVLCPQHPLYEPTDTQQEHYPELSYHRIFYDAEEFRSAFVDSWSTNAVVDLIRKLIAGTAVFYDNENCTNQVYPEFVNINADKIYILGYSFGAIAAESWLKIGRDIFAAAIHSATIVVDSFWSSSSESDESKALRTLRLQREIERYYHIPVLFIFGTGDDYYWGPRKLLTEYANVAASKGWTNNAYAVSIPNADHSMNNMAYILDNTKKFDPTSNSEQQFGSSGVCGMDWLFSLSKPTTPPDPYPDEEETYFPEWSCYLYKDRYTGQKTRIEVDKTRPIKLFKKVTNLVSSLQVEVYDAEFVNGKFQQLNDFILIDRGMPGYLDKYSTRVSFIGV